MIDTNLDGFELYALLLLNLCNKPSTIVKVEVVDTDRSIDGSKKKGNHFVKVIKGYSSPTN